MSMANARAYDLSGDDMLAPAPMEQADAGSLILAAFIFVYACLSPWLRDLGPAGIVPPAAATAALALIYARRYFQVSLLVLAGLGTVLMAVSWAGMMHRGLTLLFERDAIAQQGFYTVFLFLLVPACAHIWSQIARGAPGWRGLETIVLLLAVASMLSLVLFDMRITDGAGYGISQLINPDAIAAIILVRRFVLDEDRSWPVRFVIAVLLAATANSMQSVLALAVLIPLLVLPQFAKGIAAFVVFGLFVVAIGAQPFVRDIWWWDYNTGVRLLFWQDAWDRLIASGGAGVGFGTETIRPVYHVGIEEHVVSGLERTGYIHVAAHNAYVDAFYRMGVAGGLLVLGYIVVLSLKVIGPAREASAFDCWMVCVLAISMMVNVALASVGFVFGTGLMLGWLVYRLAQEDELDPDG